MSMMPGMQPQDAQTVSVRIQVIDVEPFSLDLRLPTYIPAKDLSQRIARDAGLGAYWEDGTRRLYWLRARGRLMGDDERLQDLGVISDELLHMLPQPPANTAVIERPPDYPETKGYAAAGWGNVVLSLLVLLVWTGAWSAALVVDQTFLVGLLPGIGLALLSVSFSRHLWGGPGTAVKIPLVGGVVFFCMLVLAAVPAVLLAGAAAVAFALAPALIGGLFGVMLGWLAWYGPVEPLPKHILTAAKAQQAQQVAAIVCGICGNEVPPEVRADCMFRCGKTFHSGCYRARQSMVGDQMCAICGYKPG